VVVSEARDQLRAGLARLGIQTAIHYPVPIHRSEAYVRQGLDRCSLPVAEALAERVCSLPLFPTLTDEEVALVADAVGSCQPGGSMAA
jgi:dTDP-4-amino-4,6-dideoxygalactose transaminase